MVAVTDIQWKNSKEKWAYVEDTKYLISTYGTVRGPSSKILKFRKTKNGYLYFSLYHKGVTYTRKPHRMVATHFIENLQCKPEVNHKDGNKENNHVDNLEWVTSSENKKHALTLGLKTNPSGVSAHACKGLVDVFDKQGKRLASIGAKGMDDYPTHIQKRGMEFAKERRRLYKIRHEKTRHRVGTPSYYADKILW